eukprot:Gregarina_sp_Poly_1__5016@NODE_265_length_10384_cov_23_891344_g231_i0_p1_GENE_NODE_265_length_10384_cov_23_891344_g231_i0NODE_265_length_10384_cov_23_891344_g231_i0_p1_ORF_typecomplete_len1211_score171_75_NODE_265_length_10384_cov_23_891344_g231_i033336965
MKDLLAAKVVTVLCRIHELTEDDPRAMDALCNDFNGAGTAEDFSFYKESQPKGYNIVHTLLSALQVLLRGLDAFDLISFCWKYGHQLRVPQYVACWQDELVLLSWLIATLRLCLELDSDECILTSSQCLARIVYRPFSGTLDKIIMNLSFHYMIPRILTGQMDCFLGRLQNQESDNVGLAMDCIFALLGVCRCYLKCFLSQVEREYFSHTSSLSKVRAVHKRSNFNSMNLGHLASLQNTQLDHSFTCSSPSLSGEYLPTSDVKLKPHWQASLDIPSLFCLLSGIRLASDQMFRLASSAIPQVETAPVCKQRTDKEAGFVRSQQDLSSKHDSAPTHAPADTFEEASSDSFACEHGSRSVRSEMVHNYRHANVHSYLSGWAIAVMTIADFYKTLTDLPHIPLPDFEPHLQESLGILDPALAVLLIAANGYGVVRDVSEMLSQSSAHVLCRKEYDLLTQIRARLGDTTRRLMSVLYTFNAAGWTCDSTVGNLEYSNLWKAQMDAVLAFLFRQETLTRHKRVAVLGQDHRILQPARVDTFLLQLDWKQGVRVFLEIARSPVFMISSLNSSIAGYNRLADAIRCAGANLTLLQLNRLVLSLISLAFGHNGFPLDRKWLLSGVARRLQGGLMTLRPRDLQLGDILGLQTCNVMQRAGLHTALRNQGLDSSLRTVLQVPMFAGLKALLEIAQLAHRLLEQNVRSKPWTKRITSGLDSLALERLKSQKSARRIPKLHSYVAKTVEDWLLVLRDGANIRVEARTSVTDVDGGETLVCPCELLDMCIRCETEAAIQLIEEGAALYSSIWQIPRPEPSRPIHGIPAPPESQYSINTFGFYLFSFCDPLQTPAAFRRRINRGKGYFLCRGLPLEKVYHSRDGFPVQCLDPGESVRLANVRFLLWTASNWPDFSQLSLSVHTAEDGLRESKTQALRESGEIRSESARLASSFLDSGIDKPSLPGNYAWSETKEKVGSTKKHLRMAGYPYSESTSDSRDELAYSFDASASVRPRMLPELISVGDSKQEKTISHLLTHRRTGTGRQHTKTSTDGENRSQFSFDLGGYGSRSLTPADPMCRNGLSHEASLAVWLTICIRESKLAFPFLIEKEEALWSGRPHPIMAQMCTDMSRLHFQSKVLNKDHHEEHVERVSLDMLEGMLERTGVVRRAWDLRTSTYSWLRDSRGENDWNWMVILQITTQVLGTTFNIARKSPALILFYEELHK